VRELRITRWNEYVEIFERYPPQLPDGITLIYTGAAHSYMASSISTEEEQEDNEYVTKTMRIPGLARLELSGGYPLILKSVLRILPLVEPPAARQVEACIRNMKLLTTDGDRSFRCLLDSLFGRLLGYLYPMYQPLRSLNE
jgi:hypothetical protein